MCLCAHVRMYMYGGVGMLGGVMFHVYVIGQFMKS